MVGWGVSWAWQWANEIWNQNEPMGCEVKMKNMSDQGGQSLFTTMTTTTTPIDFYYDSLVVVDYHFLPPWLAVIPPDFREGVANRTAWEPDGSGLRHPVRSTESTPGATFELTVYNLRSSVWCPLPLNWHPHYYSYLTTADPSLQADPAAPSPWRFC